MSHNSSAYSKAGEFADSVAHLLSEVGLNSLVTLVWPGRFFSPTFFGVAEKRVRDLANRSVITYRLYIYLRRYGYKKVVYLGISVKRGPLHNL